MLNESVSSPVFFSTAQIDDVINEAGEILAEEVSAIKRTALTTLRPGSIFYYTQGIAKNIRSIYRLWLPDSNIRLTSLSLKEMDESNEDWMNITGSPRWWIPISHNLFGLYPHAAAGGGTLQVDFLAWPDAMEGDTEESEFMTVDQDSIVLYGLYDGLLKQWNVQRALEIFSLFVDRWTDAIARNDLKRIQERSFDRNGARIG